MLSLTVLLTVLNGVPHAPADAEATLYVPRLDKAGAALPFFKAAGQHSMMLRPESWRTEMHPLLETDVTDADSLAAAGIDPTGAMTVSRRETLTVSCLTLKDSKKYQAAADTRLSRWGDVAHKVIGGVPTTISTDALGRVQAGYSLKGTEVCAFTAIGLTLDKQLSKLAAVVTKPASAAGFKIAASLPGVVFLIRNDGPVSVAAGLTGDAQNLTVDTEARGIDGSGLSSGGLSPFANAKPKGMAVVKARLSPGGILNAMNTLVARTPNGRTLRDVVPELAPVLTGNVLAATTGVKIKTGLRTVEMRYFAAQFTFVAEVKDVEVAKAALAKVDLTALKFKEGIVSIGLQGSNLYFSNSAASREAVLASLGDQTPAKQAHAIEFSVDTRAVSNGLSQVPLLEAMQSPEAAVLLGISAELGPLLNASTTASGFIDVAGPQKQKAQLIWVLAKPEGAVK